MTGRDQLLVAALAGAGRGPAGPRGGRGGGGRRRPADRAGRRRHGAALPTVRVPADLAAAAPALDAGRPTGLGFGAVFGRGRPDPSQLAAKPRPTHPPGEPPPLDALLFYGRTSAHSDFAWRRQGDGAAATTAAAPSDDGELLQLVCQGLALLHCYSPPLGALLTQDGCATSTTSFTRSFSVDASAGIPFLNRRGTVDPLGPPGVHDLRQLGRL